MSLTDSSPNEIAKAAAISSRSLAVLSTKARNAALTAVHQALSDAKKSILAANVTDLELASKAAQDGQLSQSVLKRLDLCRKGKWEDMLQGILDVRDLDDPGMRIISGVQSYSESMYDRPARSTAPQSPLRQSAAIRPLDYSDPAQ